MNVGRRDIKTTLQIGSVVALAVIVAGATIIIARVLGDQAHAYDGEMVPAAEALRAVLLWGVSFVLFIAASAWNIMVTLRVLHRFASFKAWIAIASLFILSASLSPYVSRLLGGEKSASPVDTLRMTKVTDVGDAVAAGVTCLLVASVCALIYRRASRLTPRQLRERVTYLRLSLLSAAVLLVIGVAEIYFLHDLPAYRDPIRHDSYHHIAITAAMVAGALYSACLLVLYAPAIVIYEAWISKAAEHAMAGTSSVDFKKWRENNHLTQSPSAMLLQLVAVAGPALTGLGIPKLLGGS
jgi:hypothetical protein